MIQLRQNPPELVSKRLQQLQSVFDSVCRQVEVDGSGLSGEQRTAIVDFAKSYQETLELPELEETKKLGIDDLVLFPLFQWLFGVIYTELGRVNVTFPTPFIKKDTVPDGPIPMIQAGTKPTKFIAHDNPHKGECIVISTAGFNAGSVSYWNQDVVVSVCYGFEAKPGLSLCKYLYYALKANEAQMKRQGGGTTMKNLSPSKIKRFKIPLPSLAEQQQVIDQLDAFKETIPLVESQLQDATKQYSYACRKLLDLPQNKSSVIKQRLQKLSSDFARECSVIGLDQVSQLTENERNQLLSTLKSYEPEKGLKEKTKHVELLVSLISHVYGFTNLTIGDAVVEFPTPREVASKLPEGTIPLVSGGLKPAKYISHPNPHKGEAVVVSVKGTAGVVTYWDEDIVVSDSYGVEGKPGVTTTKYLHQALKKLEPQLIRLSFGTTVPNLSAAKIRRQRILVPSLEKQAEIVEVINVFKDLVDGLTVQKTELEYLTRATIYNTFQKVPGRKR